MGYGIKVKVNEQSPIHPYIFLKIFLVNEDVGPIASIFKVKDIHTAVQGLSHAI